MKQNHDLKNFHYTVSGNPTGPWLVFIHGLLGNSNNWAKVKGRFERDFHVLVYDQRGHGKSFKPEKGYHLEDYAADLKFIFDQLKIKKAIVIGHSMAGRVAMRFCALYPEYISKLIIEDIAPTTANMSDSPLLTKLKKVPVPFESMQKAKEYLMNEFGDSKLGVFLYTNFEEHADGKAYWRVPLRPIVDDFAEDRKISRWQEYTEISCPIFIIRGEKSTDLSRENFDKMLQDNPHARGVEIKNAGHWVHFDEPEEFVKEVMNELGRD